MPDEPDVVQIQMSIQSAVDEAVRNIREHVFRQVMVMVNNTQMEEWHDRYGEYDAGFADARMKIYYDIEAMIAKDAAT